MEIENKKVKEYNSIENDKIDRNEIKEDEIIQNKIKLESQLLKQFTILNRLNFLCKKTIMEFEIKTDEENITENENKLNILKEGIMKLFPELNSKKKSKVKNKNGK